MGLGLQLWDSTGRLTFDSAQATGGVCLGFVTVPAAPYPFTQTTVITYPIFGPGHTGFTINPCGGLGGLTGDFVYDNELGYPRFTFAGASYDRTILLFLK